MSRLLGAADGQDAGCVSLAEDGLWTFDYAPSWGPFSLSPPLTKNQRHHGDTPAARKVEWFFDNLLAEGRMRELVAARDRIDPRDTWGLLRRHGQDTAGALSVMPEGVEERRESAFLPLSRHQLQEKILGARGSNRPLIAAWDDMRMSLAGAQEKLGLRIDASGEMFLPLGAAASTHIVKPENASDDFPFCPANEFFCMRLAGRLGLPVPEVHLLHLPAPLYVVSRFDRKVAADGSVARLHQIDLCQALGVPASKKYESEGGIGVGELFTAIDPSFVARPIAAARALIQWFAFNYLIGNLDAHAKNIAFLMHPGRAQVAPFYDLLCVEAYLPRQTMAMSIGGENKPGWVEARHWDALAAAAGVAPRAVRGTLLEMIEKLPTAIAVAAADAQLLRAEQDFLHARVRPVIEERVAFVKAALGR